MGGTIPSLSFNGLHFDCNVGNGTANVKTCALRNSCGSRGCGNGMKCLVNSLPGPKLG